MSDYVPPSHSENEPPPIDPGSLRPRDNVMAVASLVCGLLCCTLGVTSLLAVVFGIIGLRRTRDGSMRGEGMASAGLVLGVVGLVIWGVMGSGMGWLISRYVHERQQAQQMAEAFVQDVLDGKIDAAMARALPAVERKKLASISEGTKAFGPLSHINVEYTPVNAPPTAADPFFTRWVINGIAVFSRGSRNLSMAIIKEGDTYKVEHFDLN